MRAREARGRDDPAGEARLRALFRQGGHEQVVARANEAARAGRAADLPEEVPAALREALLAAGILWLLGKTMRVRTSGFLSQSDFWDDKSPRIFVFWHNRQLMMPFIRNTFAGHPRKVAPAPDAAPGVAAPASPPGCASTATPGNPQARVRPMSRDMRDLSPGTYVMNPDTLSGSRKCLPNHMFWCGGGPAIAADPAAAGLDSP